METATQISAILDRIQKERGFTDQQLAAFVGVSRWTIYRIRKGEIGDTISTSLVGTILREQRYTPAEQVA